MNAPLSLSRDSPRPRAALLTEWRVALRLLTGAALFGAIVGSIGCSSSTNPAAPSGSAIVTIRVVDEQYRLLLTTPPRSPRRRRRGPAAPTAFPTADWWPARR